MKITHLAAAAATAAAALLVLSGCAGATAPSGSADSGYSAPADDSGTSSDAAVGLTAADSDLGTIVVDGDGRTVYQFDTDSQGGDSSACAGQCAAMWPAVPGSDAPELDGVTGEVGTITGTDGQPQLTLNGWPLYYYIGDDAAGDVQGQGVGGIWWVLTPAGEPIRG